MTAQRLPDTGGYYFDRQDAGVVTVVRRNVRSAVESVTSGDAGGQAMAAVAGAVAFFLGRKLLAATDSEV